MCTRRGEKGRHSGFCWPIRNRQSGRRSQFSYKPNLVNHNILTTRASVAQAAGRHWRRHWRPAGGEGTDGNLLFVHIVFHFLYFPHVMLPITTSVARGGSPLGPSALSPARRGRWGGVGATAFLVRKISQFLHLFTLLVTASVARGGPPLGPKSQTPARRGG